MTTRQARKIIDQYRPFGPRSGLRKDTKAKATRITGRAINKYGWAAVRL